MCFSSCLKLICPLKLGKFSFFYYSTCLMFVSELSITSAGFLQMVSKTIDLDCIQNGHVQSKLNVLSNQKYMGAELCLGQINQSDQMTRSNFSPCPSTDEMRSYARLFVTFLHPQVILAVILAQFLFRESFYYVNTVLILDMTTFYVIFIQQFLSMILGNHV